MQTFRPSLRLAWWKMTIRRQDSAHIFSVAESFSNYSQDQDPMSSFVIGTKITVLWCTKCYYHDSHNDDDDDDDGGDGVVRQWFLGRMIRSGWRREVASEPFPSRPEHQLMIQKFLLSLHHSSSPIGHHHYQEVSSLENYFISWHWLVVLFFSFWGSLYLLLWLSEGISVEHKSTSLEDISADNLPRSRPRAHHCWRVLASTESSDGHNPQGCLGYTHPGSEMCSICGNVFCAAECSAATGRS